MTIVSNDPILWPLIKLFHINSYFPVASLCIVVYDCTLTFSQELDLVWRKQWTLMTALYLIVRYVGIPFHIMDILATLQSVSLTDAELGFSGTFVYIASRVVSLVVNAALDVIMVARLYAMYQGSKKMLMSLSAILIPATITCAVLLAVQLHQSSVEEGILSGTHQCVQVSGTSELLAYTWVVGIVWQVLIISLAIWSAVKHFRERLEGWNVKDCFAVLIRTHMFYFSVFLFVSCISLGLDFESPNFINSTGGVICLNVIEIFASLQIFVLGPRLILGVRENHAEVVDGSEEEASDLGTIAFKQRSRTSADGV